MSMLIMFKVYGILNFENFTIRFIYDCIIRYFLTLGGVSLFMEIFC